MRISYSHALTYVKRGKQILLYIQVAWAIVCLSLIATLPPRFNRLEVLMYLFFAYGLIHIAVKGFIQILEEKIAEFKIKNEGKE